MIIYKTRALKAGKPVHQRVDEKEIAYLKCKHWEVGMGSVVSGPTSPLQFIRIENLEKVVNISTVDINTS